MVDFPLEKETPKVNSIPFILGPADSPANIPLKNLPGQHGLRSPIIRKFMEADRTYSDGFIGAYSNKKKWTTSLENIQGLPIKKMDHPIDCQA